MDANRLEQKLRNTPGLTDELRADLWDLAMGNHESIKDPLLKAIAIMQKMDPAQLDRLEKNPTLLNLVLPKGNNHAKN